MLRTSRNILNKPWLLSLLSGLSVFLAFEEFGLVPLILFFPWLFNSMFLSVKSGKQAFVWGFFTSLIIMLGGFYWVTYVIHEFGDLPWSVSGLLFLCFCGFGSLNFPIFSAIAHWLQKNFYKKKRSILLEGIWYCLALPSLFAVCEWAVPKLFPWYIGHAFYKQLWLIQICELTGATFLTFCLYSLGSTLGWFANASSETRNKARGFLLIPLSCFLILVFFSLWTFRGRQFQPGKELKVALIQANIGSLDKLKASQGIVSLVDQVLNTYQDMTKGILNQNPNLILWPETAIPLELNRESTRQTQIFKFVEELKTPLIAGGYAASPHHVYRSSNSAFLLDPTVSPLRVDTYHKNILLAFGEYLPLGDTFPALYKTFPQVSDFERGRTQNIFTLSDGTRLGISICYEAIVPAFMRKIGRQNVNAMVNLTNDSWFGPTSEPHLHGALTVFRAIEHRVPLIRVTNTGTSFAVNHLGEMSKKTSVYRAENPVTNITTMNRSEPTFYGLYGDWVIGVMILILIVFIYSLWRHRETLPV